MAEKNEKLNNFNKGRLTQKVTEHERRLNGHDEVHKDMWDTINAIRNRPPIWVTIVIAILLAVVSWFARASYAG